MRMTAAERVVSALNATGSRWHQQPAGYAAVLEVDLPDGPFRLSSHEVALLAGMPQDRIRALVAKWKAG